MARQPHFQHRCPVWTRVQVPYLMGMSFMTSRNMDGETAGSHSLGSSGSRPLSITFLSNSHRLKDSRGGSMPAADTHTI